MKRIILVYLVFFVFTSFIPLNAQWAKVYGINITSHWYPYHNLKVNSFHQTNDGGYIIAGGANGVMWILKLDSTGGIEWQRAFIEDEVWSVYPAYSIQQTSDGGYIVAGSARNPEFATVYILILKLDSTGGIEWQRVYGEDEDGSYNSAYSVQQTSDGGYIVACADFRILKLDSAGNIEWQRDYGGDYEIWAKCIQLTSDGGFILGGGTFSFGEEYGDFLVLKVDSTGGIEWQRVYGGSSSEWAKSIQQTSDGGFILGGYTSSFGSGSADIWVLKLDSTGDIDWQRTYGGSEMDQVNSIQQINDGEYIITGSTSSFGNGGYDIWVLKLNPAGEIEWQRTYGRASDDDGSVALQISDGGYIVAGEIGSCIPRQYWDFGTWMWQVGGRSSILILKISPNGDIDPSCELIGSSNASVLDTDVTPYEINIIPQDIDFTALDTNIVPYDTDADVNRFWPDRTIFDLSISSTSGGYTEPLEYTPYTFASETDISIKAVPEDRYRFNGWTGDVLTGHENDNPFIITMDSDKSISANFSLIEEDKKGPCFIATATYSSPSHPYVKILREFRDRYLLPNKIGQAFINFYYKYSPFVADLIAKHELLKIGVQISLVPLVVVSYFMLNYEPATTAFMVLLIFILLVFFNWLHRKKLRGLKA